MAFNWQTFKTRTLTAAVFVVVMLFGLFWNVWSFFVLFSVVHIGCWNEYLKLIEKIQQKKLNSYLRVGLITIGFAILIWFFYHPFYFSWFDSNEVQRSYIALSIAFLLGILLTIIGIGKNSQADYSLILAIIGGFIYISLSIGLLFTLNNAITFFYSNHVEYTFGGAHFSSNISGSIPVMIIFSLWVNDTMAYIIGSIIGKTPFSKISPKKTWEGTVGGIILTLGVAYLVASLADLNILHVLITAGLTCIVGTIGDLFESKLKRMAGVKDSGHIMPGHGGFLDRFDSLLFATPFVWLYVYFFM